MSKTYRMIDITNGTSKKPPYNKKWLILGGTVEHTNGTDSKVSIVSGNNDLTNPFVRLASYPSAWATQALPLYAWAYQYVPIVGESNDIVTPLPPNQIVAEDSAVYFEGAGTARVRMWVEESPLD